MKYILILWSVLWSLSVLGQTFSYFNKTWGDEFNYLAFSNVLTAEDGYWVVGSYADTVEYSPIDLLKFDLLGNLLWRKNLCQLDSKDTYIIQKDAIIDNEGNIVIGSLVEDFEIVSSRDTRIIKLTNNGEIIWKNDYGSEQNESLSQLIQTNDGGYLVVGSKQNVTPVQFSYIYIY